LRRVPVARETSNIVVAGVLPQGYVRPATQGIWRDHLREVLDAQPIRDDRYETVEAVALTVMYWADWDTMASRPTWAELIARCIEKTGRGYERTIARHLAYLIQLNVIARAATGRRGCHAPGGCQEKVSNWKNSGPCKATPDSPCPPDEAAVYVLCIPSPIHAVEDTDDTPQAQESAVLAPWDGLGAPPTLRVVSSLPVRARHGNAEYDPLRGTAFQAAQAPQPCPGSR
jgi:hypothetical protein